MDRTKYNLIQLEMSTLINAYNIVCITDDLYAQHAGVMMASLFTHTLKPCRIFVLTNSLTLENKNKLRSIVTKSQYSTIQFIEKMMSNGILMISRLGRM